MLVPKAPGWGPRPLLGCCSWDCDSYEKQRRGDPKSLRFKSRAARRATAERERSPLRRLRRLGFLCGSGVSNRQLPSSEPARSASGETREPLLRPLPSALGQRPLAELRVRERSGKWRRLSQPGDGRTGKAEPEDPGGGRKRRRLARPRAAAGSTAAGSGSGAPAPRSAPRLPRRPWLLLATGATPGTAAGCHRNRLPALQGPTAAQHLAVPRRPRAARRARLCEVEPIVQHGRLAQGSRHAGKAAFSLQCLV